MRRGGAGAALCALFFCSGASGLIYQVAWVRQLGHSFGNTVHSASLVVAVFMVGLGVGGYLVGHWADRRYATRPNSLLGAYAWAELLIAALGAGLAVALPFAVQLSSAISSYVPDANGWQALSPTSYVLRAAVAAVLLSPMTVLMGGTLSLLIRHVTRSDLSRGTTRTAVLYGVNTVGAAGGCFLTDFVLVPGPGLHAAQLVAVALNVVAGAGAFLLIRFGRGAPATGSGRRSARTRADPHRSRDGTRVLALTGLALALTGFAGMGMEILWLRHFSLLLGQFRVVFSLLLTVILMAMGAGALIGAFLHRLGGRPAHWLIVAQGLFVVSTLVGLTGTSADDIRAVAGSLDPAQAAAADWTRRLRDAWFNLRPIVTAVGLPALVMGCAFPLGNAVVQRMEETVGRRAGLLYLSNTAGSVAGSLVAGFVLLPRLGIQQSATLLCITAAVAVWPLSLAGRGTGNPDATLRGARVPLLASTLAASLALGLWIALPPTHLVLRAQALPVATDRILALHEGVTEVIAVAEIAGQGRVLMTNGHPMAGTTPLAQRYMRALAHIPLLSLHAPRRVLVVGFGVGNTTHAATLHPSVERVEVVELSRDILAHAPYFADANANVLDDPRVSVFINDGRQHLQMPSAAGYDLITLEPPPIAHAGVAALYSREFYQLARTRLTDGGYLSQWLPAYQVPPAATLAMVRAFIDVFPQAVLLSGAKADLLLVGAKAARVEIDPVAVERALANAPAVHADLERLALGNLREIVGTFLGSARNLAEASRDVRPVTDDRPIQEYSVGSLLNPGRHAVPAALLDLTQVPSWCPRCFLDGRPIARLEGLDTYLTLLDRYYGAPPPDGPPPPFGARTVDGNAYLGAILPETADVQIVLGIAMTTRGQLEEATAAFQQAVTLDPGSAEAHWRLGRATAPQDPEGALVHLRQAVALDPMHAIARYDLAVGLMRLRRDEEAVGHFRRALPSFPEPALAHNGLGIALASLGRTSSAVDHFRAAVRIQPGYVQAYNNLGSALAALGLKDDAVEQFRHALTLHPGYENARRNLAVVQQDLPAGFDF